MALEENQNNWENKKNTIFIKDGIEIEDCWCKWYCNNQNTRHLNRVCKKEEECLNFWRANNNRKFWTEENYKKLTKDILENIY